MRMKRTFLQVESVGIVSPLLLDKDGFQRCVTFSDCLFLADHSHNLFSVSKVRQNGAQVNFGQSLSTFVKGNATIPFEEHANLYVLKGKTFDLCSSSGENAKASLWHCRLGHNHFKNVKRLAHHVSGSHDGNQYCKKWRKENRNSISFSLAFWDRCQLLWLVTIHMLFLLRRDTASTQR